jgi:2-dehydropantoate 2-reductase
MNIAIIGTGGVGGYFGGKLALAGNTVNFLARGKHLEAIQTKGLFVKSIQGDFHVSNIKASDKISDFSIPELIIIAVKAWQVKEIAQELKHIITDKTVIIPLQNGVLASEELTEILGPKPVLGGLCRIISKIEEAGVISHLGVEPTIIFGELNNEKTARVLKILEVIQAAGINSKIAPDIQAELWKKFIAICVSGFLAVTRSTYGVVREINETRNMMHDLMQEIFEVSQKMKVNIPADFVDRALEFIDSFPYDSTSSLTRDVWEGKPSEIEYQNGTVVKFGEKYHIDTPVNRFVYNCIIPLERKARGLI